MTSQLRQVLGLLSLSHEEEATISGKSKLNLNILDLYSYYYDNVSSI